MSSCCCVACVPQDKAILIEQFGKFRRVGNPGLNAVICCIGEQVAGSVSLRVDQLDVVCETKTKDDVFVSVIVSVQYEVIRKEIYNAYYKLTNPRQQITAYVFDVVRSALPRIILDDTFTSKDEIAAAVKEELSKIMPGYGFNILQTLVTDITPDHKVKEAMNEINAAQRLRMAATDKAEAEKILVVKAAEADATSMRLKGEGVSQQRQAIVNGLQESVSAFTDNVGEINAKDVFQLILHTQYYDMMTDIGRENATVIVPHNPGQVGDVGGQLRNALLESSAATANIQKKMKR